MERGIESMSSAWGRKTRTKEQGGGPRSYIPTHGCWILQADWQNEPSTRAVWEPRAAAAERTIRLNCEPRWPRLDSTDTLRGCTLTRSCAAPCAIRSGTAKRASNKETLTVAGSRIPVIPQLTADTMRHRRTRNVPFPMGKNEENREIRGFWFAGSAGCTLERPPMPRRAPK